ncbi:MAG: hypothetical protein F4Z40_08035 [Chloroflexi bacterium]|nr:hypothetical protein [Chloroflexota bacterium]
MSISIEQFESAVRELASAPDVDWRRTTCGVTRAGREIVALVNRNACPKEDDRVQVMLVGGLSGNSEDVEIALRATRFLAINSNRPRIALTSVPCANPGGLALGSGPANGAGGQVDLGYPPAGGFFNHPTSPESRYLWRWICYQAPDVVIEVRSGKESFWESNAAASALQQALVAGPATPRDSLIAALGEDARVDPGSIPGVRLTADSDSLGVELGRFIDLIGDRLLGPSRSRQVIEARESRDPSEVGRDLARTNGRTLDPINYTQGVAISGRLRFALLEATLIDDVSDIALLVEPLTADPGNVLRANPGAPALATVVWAEEMLALTGDDRYGNVLATAMQVFVSRGRDEPPFPLDPNFIAEDHFFASAVIGRAARINPDSNTDGYVNALTEFLLKAGIQDSSGLFRHSRNGPVYWGRGNGFAAMGLAEYLTYIPEKLRRDDREIESKFRRHMDAVRALQQPSGMYLQVLDFPGSYQELTATCMIGYAMARGIRLGILDGGFRQSVGRAWRAAAARIDTAGNVTDGCASTGVMDGLQLYLDRPANSGYDDRTGAMALWFAAEMARLISEEGG